MDDLEALLVDTDAGDFTSAEEWLSTFDVGAGEANMGEANAGELLSVTPLKDSGALLHETSKPAEHHKRPSQNTIVQAAEHSTDQLSASTIPILQGFPHDIQAKGSSSVVGTTASTPVSYPAMTFGAAKRTARTSCKKQLEDMRDLAAKLTTELDELKTSARISVSTPIARLSASAVVTTRSHGVRVWKRFAARQRDRRQCTEEENRLLREAVDVHLRRAKRLRQMIKRRAAEEERLAVQTLYRRPFTIVPTRLEDDELMFQRFAVGMDELYAGVDGTFRRARMREIGQPGRRFSARGSVLDSWTVEIRDVTVLPFEFKRTDRAMWIYQTGATISCNSHEAKRSCQFSIEHAIGVLSMQQRKLVRRYFEGDRTVLVVRETIEPMPGVAVDITTLMIVKCGPPSVTGPTSIVEIFMCGSGSADANVQQRISQRSSADGDEFSISLWDSAISRMHDSVESLLVGRSAEERLGG